MSAAMAASPFLRRAEAAAAALRALPAETVQGRVAAASALSLEVTGLQGFLGCGARVEVEGAAGPVAAEIVALSVQAARAMPFGALEGVRLGAPVRLRGTATLSPGAGWLGRVVDPLGRPMDGRGPLPPGPAALPVR
ncbi:flagellum-specific ATP synthase FliI, partial [Pseudoroseomonas aestuarii]